jgi:hypothetical protein
MSMFPSYKNKSEMKKKWEGLMQQVELDNQIEAAKQEMFKDMIWATDIDKKSIKGFTSTPPTLDKNRYSYVQEQMKMAMEDPIYLKQKEAEMEKNKPISKDDIRDIIKEELDNTIGKPDPYKKKFEEIVRSNPDFFRAHTYKPLNKQGTPLEKKYVDEFAGIKTEQGNDSNIGVDYEKTFRDLERRLNMSDASRLSDASSLGAMSPSELDTPNITGKDKMINYFRNNPGLGNEKHSPISNNDGKEMAGYYITFSRGTLKVRNRHSGEINNLQISRVDWDKTFEHIKDKRVDQTEAATRRMDNLNIRGQSDSSSSSASATSNNSMGQGVLGRGISGKILTKRRVLGGMAIPKTDTLAKDYLWRPIGSKFVNLKSLGQGFLSIKHPSGQPVGRRVKINDDIADMIREYVFDGKFDLDKYEALPQSSKEFMYDLMKITRLTNAFRKPLTNPYGARDYNAELDKLIGEIRVGNDNKANKDEMKRILLHMIETKTISDSKLRSLLPLI